MANDDLTLEGVDSDIDRALARLKKSTARDAWAELANNVYPLLKTLVAATAVRFESVEEVLEEGGIPDELIEMVTGLMQIGTAICDEFEKRPDLADDVKLAITAHRNIVEKLDAMLNDLTADDDGDDTDDTDGDGDE